MPLDDERLLIGEHQARLDGHDRDLAEIKIAVNEIRDSVKHLEALASFGNGAIAVLVKVGAVVSFLVFAGVYLYNAFHGR